MSAIAGIAAALFVAGWIVFLSIVMGKAAHEAPEVIDPPCGDAEGDCERCEFREHCDGR